LYENGKVDVEIINSIGRQAFHQLLPANAVPEIVVGEEVEWFADVMKTVIGTIGFDGKYKGWNYAILERDTTANFLITEQHSNFPTRQTARVAMWRRMAGVEAAEAWWLAT
jgi:hypothetical protein